MISPPFIAGSYTNVYDGESIWLATNYSLNYVGYYLTASAVISLICIRLSGREEV
jgi:hypothetical protein